MKVLDLPPVWLAGLLGVAYLMRLALPELLISGVWLRGFATLLIVLGVGIMLAALWEFWHARTTVVPRNTPSAFLRRGIYRFTRNPIYLGDALVLSGAILWWGVLPALILVPLFIALINKRFILGEEATLRDLYADEYDQWSKKTQRWLW